MSGPATFADRSADGAPDLVIAAEDPRGPESVALLEAHMEMMRATSPPEHVHALDLDALCRPDIAFVGARRGGVLLGVGALRRLDTARAELKSMHTAHAARGQGVGWAVLQHLLGLCRERGHDWVGLETGSMAAFAPARTLYARAGFAECEPFDAYTVNPYSTCMSLRLR